jgi:hypothetical protein
MKIKSKIKWLTRKEFDDMLESRSQRTLGISIQQFKKKYKLGHYKGIDTSPIIELIMLSGVGQKEEK